MFLCELANLFLTIVAGYTAIAKCWFLEVYIAKLYEICKAHISKITEVMF